MSCYRCDLFSAFVHKAGDFSFVCGKTAFDIIGNLPLELVQKVLNYLEGRDLYNCTLVSKRWREVSNTDYLWKKIVEVECHEELKYLKQEGSWQSTYLCCYIRHRNSIQSWGFKKIKKRGHKSKLREKTYLLSPSGFTALAQIGNGGVLAILEPTGLLRVLDFNRQYKVNGNESNKTHWPAEIYLSKGNIFQTNNGLVREEVPMPKLLDKKRVRVHQAENLIIFEKLSKESRYLREFLWDPERRCLNDPRGGGFGFKRGPSGELLMVSSESETSSEFILQGVLVAPSDTSPSASHSPFTKITLLISDSKMKKIIFWDYKMGLKGEIAKPKSKICWRHFLFQDLFIISSFSEVICWDSTAKLKFKLSLKATDCPKYKQENVGGNHIAKIKFQNSRDLHFVGGSERLEFMQQCYPDLIDEEIPLDDVCLQFNKEILMIEIQQTGILGIAQFWDLKTLKLYDFMLASTNEMRLHPKDKIVMYTDADQVSDLLSCDIISVSLVSGDCIWRIRVTNLFYSPCDYFTNSGHLSLIHNRFLLFVPDFDNDPAIYREQLLIDTYKKGKFNQKVIWHERSKEFKIKYVGGKILEGRTSSGCTLLRIYV